MTSYEGPEENLHSFSLQSYMKVRGQLHAPAALPPHPLIRTAGPDVLTVRLPSKGNPASHYTHWATPATVSYNGAQRSDSNHHAVWIPINMEVTWNAIELFVTGHATTPPTYFCVTLIRVSMADYTRNNSYFIAAFRSIWMPGLYCLLVALTFFIYLHLYYQARAQNWEKKLLTTCSSVRPSVRMK